MIVMDLPKDVRKMPISAIKCLNVSKYVCCIKTNFTMSGYINIKNEKVWEKLLTI